MDELGRGGFGCVYLAFDASVGRQVAIKVLTEGGKDVLARFRNEALVAGNLRHENIVTVYEYGDYEGQPFLAMEYLEGEDLQHIISAHKPLTLLEKVKIMSQVAEGLACAHRNGVVHRDVKPANIMVLPDGRVKIMDFGIARLTEDRDATRLTQEGWLVGTLLYMAPEQFGGAEVDALCDLFAYGVIYYELLTGRHPFEAPDSRTMMYKISFEDPPPVRDFAPDCPEALERVVLRILHKDRELRYQSLKDVQFDTDVVRIDLQKQRAEELLAQAQAEDERNQLDSAEKLLREVLGLDPSNAAARSMRESLQKRLQRRALQPRIEALAGAGEEHLAHRRFSEAVQSFEAALKLEKENAALEGRLDHARSLLEHSRTAQALIAEARKELDRHNLTGAHRSVSEALRHDPGNDIAAELLAKIQTEIEQRQRQQRIDEALHRAESFVLLRSYDEAMDLLTGLGADAESPKVERLLAWLRSEKAEQERRQKLQDEVAAVTDLLRGRSLPEAVKRLEALQKDYPDEQEVAHLLAYAKKESEAEARAAAIKEVVTRAGALTESNDFVSALTLLEDALKQYPGETALIRTLGRTMAEKAAWERRQAIENTLRECGHLRARERFAEAIELVEATLREYSSEPELVELLEQLEQDWARKRRAEAVRKAAEHASRMLERKQALEAQQYLRQALIQYPGDDSLAGLLKRAEDEQRAIEKARAIEAIVREASARAAAEDFGRALEAIDQGIQTWENEGTLLALRRQIADRQAAWKRTQEVQACAQQAGALASSLKFAEALELIARTLHKYSGEAELAELEKRIALEWEQHKRAEAIRGIASEARLLLSRGRLQEAAEIVDEGLAHYEGEAELEALSGQIREAIRARERVRAIENIIRESQDFAAAHRFDEASAVLDRGLAAFPSTQALLRQLESVRHAAKEWQREQAVVRAVVEAGRLAGDRNFDAALEALARAPGSSPELIAAREQIERDRDEHRRREAVDKGAAETEALLQNGQLEAAGKLLEQLSSRYPHQPRWDSLRARVDSAVRERKAAEERRRAIEEAIRQCGELAGQARFEEALEGAAAALRKYPEDPALLGLVERLKLSWDERKHAEAIAQAAAEAGSLIDAGRLEDAIETLRRYSAQYSGEATLSALLAKAERDLAARQERERALDECGRMLAEQRQEDAIRLLEGALARFPADRELLSLASRARQELDLRQREEAIAALLEDARAFAQSRDFDRALLLLERGLANWPGEERLLALQQSVRSGQADWKREQTRRQAVQEVQQLARRERFREAREHAEGALRTFPDDAELLRLRNDCRMREVLAAAASIAAQGRPQDGLAMMAEAPPDCAAAPEWAALAERLRAEAAALERIDAIRRTAAEALASADRADFDGAMALLKNGLREWPGEASLEDARRSVIARQEAHERQLAVQNAVAQCIHLAEGGHLQQALEHAAESLRQFPDELRLLELRKPFEEEWKAEQRRGERQRDIDELRGIDTSLSRASGPARIAELGENVQRIVASYSGEKEILAEAATPLAHMRDMETAGTKLRERDFSAVIEICRKYLARYPEHVTFRALERDAERGRHRAEVEEIRRRADGEPDLATRANILEEALARYPDEAWIAGELRLTSNKLGLAEAIVAEARAYEAAGAWTQALEQWNKLATIYDRFPGLSQEIERVSVARERAHAEAIARWMGQIEQMMQAAEFGKAREALGRALTELPEAVQLQNLGRRLDDLRDKQRRVRDLLTAMRESRGHRDWDKFQAQAAQALELCTENAALRKSVCERLIEHAGEIVETDWRRAEASIALVRSAEPAYAPPEPLARAIASGKRAAAVEAALCRAEELQAAGDRRGALAHLASALREFPDDPQLENAHNAIDEQLQKERAGLITELREIRGACGRASEPGELEGLNTRVRAIAAEVTQDAELTAAAAETLRAIALRRRELGRERILALVTSNRKLIAIALGTVGLLSAGVLVLGPFLRSLRGVPVTITSDTVGVSVAVGSARCVIPQCTLKLRPGTYTLTAGKDGFQAITRPMTVKSGDSGLTIPLVFEPLPEELQLDTNFESGSVYLDGQAAGSLHESQFSVSGLRPGRHSIRVTGGDAEFRAVWQSVPGSRPELIGSLSAKNVQAAVVANAGGNGTVACNCEPGTVLVDGSPAGRTVAAGEAPLAQLQQGPRQVVVGGRSVVVNIRSNPALNIFLALDRNVGSLVINTGEDNAKVYLNSRLYPRRTEHGVVRIPVETGAYSIRVEKDNFRSSAAQTASVAKGEEKQVTFTLAPVPPVLEIAGAQPHSRVLADGRAIGETDGNGHFRAEVPAGQHRIEISKDGYATARFDAAFAAGREVAVRPGPTQVAIAKLPASPPPATEPKQVDTETQDWARAANTARIPDLQEYLRKHPGGAHDSDARNRIDQLQKAEAARSEQAAWEGVDQTSKAALQDFLSRHGNGPYAQQARGLLDAMQKREAADAAASAERDRQQKRAEQEREARAAETQAIVQTLSDYERAFNRMDLTALQQLYNPMPAAQREQFRYFKTVSFQMKPTEPPAINGDSATVVCNRSERITTKEGLHLPARDERVRVTLARTGTRWTIREITPY